MTLFLGLGLVGLAVLVVALLLGDIADISGHLEFLDSEWFSTASLAGFVSALGFAGLVTSELTRSPWLPWVVGAVAGVLVAWLAARLSRTLRRSTTGEASNEALVGSSAVVISSLPAGGYGEVRLSFNGHPLKMNARSASGPLSQGTRVWVSAVLSPTAVEVTPTDALAAPVTDALPPA